MKLHLPKMLFVALLACFGIAQAATLSTTTTSTVNAINLNFGADRASLSGRGDITIDGMTTDVSQWINLKDASSTDMIIHDTLGNAYKLTYSSPNTWYGGSEPDTFVKSLTTGYLDISNEGTTGIHIALTQEDGTALTDWNKINIIFSGDSGSYTNVTVNGTDLYYDNGVLTQGSGTWGTRSRSDTIVEGTNLMVITPTDVQATGVDVTAGGDTYTRSTIAGMQIVLGDSAVDAISGYRIAEFCEGDSANLSDLAQGTTLSPNAPPFDVVVTASDTVGDSALLTIDQRLTAKDLTVHGGSLNLNITADTTIGELRTADGGSLGGLSIAAGSTLTLTEDISSFNRAVGGNGKLVLAMTNPANPAQNGDNIVNLGSENALESVRIHSGVIAANLANEASIVSDLGSADLIMGHGTTYAVRAGIGGSADITRGAIRLEGGMNLQVYTSVENTALSNTIDKAADASFTAINKKGLGTITLTGNVNADGLYVGDGTLILGAGNNTTVSQLRLSEQGGDDNKLVINTGATLTLTGEGVNNHAKDDSIVLAHWGNTGFLEINGGTLDAQNARVLASWDGTGTMSLNAGAAKIKGFDFWASKRGEFRGCFKLGDADAGTGVLELGSDGFRNVNGDAQLSFGNGTVQLVADSSVTYNPDNAQGAVEFIGTAGGTVFDTNGYDMSFGPLNITGGGDIVKTGAGRLTFDGDLTVGSITVEGGALSFGGTLVASAITVEGGTLTLNGALGSTCTITTTGSGFLALGEMTTTASFDLQGGTLGVGGMLTLDGSTLGATSGKISIASADLVNFAIGAGSFKDVDGSTTTGNGFDNGSEHIIVSGGTITSDVTVEVEGRAYTITDDSRGIVTSTSTDYSAYYLNRGSATLSVVQDAATSAGASLSTVNMADGTTLNVNTSLSDEQNIFLAGNATVNIGARATVKKAGITLNGNELTIAGSGTYNIGNSLESNAILASDWTGAVVIEGYDFRGQASVETSAMHLNDTSLSHEQSYVGLSHCTGWLTPSSDNTITANILMMAGDALTLTDGSNGRLYTFSGKIKGEGDFVLNMEGKSVTGSTFKFNGDVSEWSGAFRVVNPTTDSEFNLEFTGRDRTQISTGISAGEGTTLNVTVGGDGDCIISGNIVNEGVLNLTANGGGYKYFTGDISASKLSTDSSTDVYLMGTSTIGTLENSSTISNMGTLSITEALHVNPSGLICASDLATSTFVAADGVTPSTDGNGYASSASYYVVQSWGGTLQIDESLLTNGFSRSGDDLLYTETDASVYFINTPTTYTGGDVANVGAGKSISVRDGAELRLTSAAFAEGVTVNTVGWGFVTLDLNTTQTVGDLGNLLGSDGTSIGTMFLAEGTKLEITAREQIDLLSKVSHIIVQNGASFSDQMVVGAISGDTSFIINGHGRADDGDNAGALVFGENMDQGGLITLNSSITLTADATICTIRGSRNTPVILAGEITGNGHTLVKTGGQVLTLGSLATGADRILDAALDIRVGTLALAFSNRDMALNGTAHTVSGEVTMADGTTLAITKGYTRLAGGLDVTGEVLIESGVTHGLEISGRICGDSHAVINLLRTDNEAAGSFNTLVLSADNSESFTGTYVVNGKWDIRADHQNALANADVNLGSGRLTIGGSTDTIKLAGLSGNADSNVTGDGVLEITGTGTHTFEGTVESSVKISGACVQEIGRMADNTSIEVANEDAVLVINSDVSASNITVGGTLSAGGAIEAGHITVKAGDEAKQKIDLGAAFIAANGDKDGRLDNVRIEHNEDNGAGHVSISSGTVDNVHIDIAEGALLELENVTLFSGVRITDAPATVMFEGTNLIVVEGENASCTTTTINGLSLLGNAQTEAVVLTGELGLMEISCNAFSSVVMDGSLLSLNTTGFYDLDGIDVIRLTFGQGADMATFAQGTALEVVGVFGGELRTGQFKEGDDKGVYFVVKQQSQSVPEPATATLSLLALAALAYRRRRKAA